MVSGEGKMRMENKRSLQKRGGRRINGTGGSMKAQCVRQR